MTKKKYGIGSLIADGAAALLAPATFGASLIISPTARNLVGDVFSGGSSDDNTSNLTKQWEIQNEQWKKLSEERRVELEKLRKERQEKNSEIKQNSEEIDRLRTIINDPSKSEEEKNNARKRIVVLEGDNRNLKKKLDGLENKIKDKEKPLPVPSAPSGLSLPKFSAYDKAIIAGILVLVIYFLFLRDNKKK